MSIRSTGRCRRSSGNGLSAILIACMTLIFALSGCAASGSEGPPPPAVGQQTNEPAAVAGTEPASITDPRPVRIAIPAIGVDSDLMELGLESNGALQVPPGGFPAGWYSGSPVPGELGPAVIAGHVDWGGKPGVFFRLHELAPGTRSSPIGPTASPRCSGWRAWNAMRRTRSRPPRSMATSTTPGCDSLRAG
ncbi:hypothetical protein P9209_25115 [Prescottella defluvii]|nr:hypothetical protein P9209_25115 [Prescottella defluvii]